MGAKNLDERCGLAGILVLARKDGDREVPCIRSHSSLGIVDVPLIQGDKLIITDSPDGFKGKTLTIGCPLKSMEDDRRLGSIYPIDPVIDTEIWISILQDGLTKIEII